VKRILVDAGPLVAALDRRDRFHSWAVETLRSLRPPLITCEAVATEAFHLLRRTPNGPQVLLDVLSRGAVEIDFRLGDDLSGVSALVRRYADVPMSLADACLVRMAEADRDSVVMTLDGDFRVYRLSGRRAVPVLMPPQLS
jgi:predicted nucleic acid-binding protein